MAFLGRRTAVPTKSMGYAPGHGAALRSSRRSFARSVARKLAETKMEELERAQLGETEEREHALKLAEMGTKASMAEIERAQIGETKRTGMREAGLGTRLGREQEFARPLQKAEIGRMGGLKGLREAEAGKIRYGTEFAKGARSTLESILESQKRLGEAEAAEAGLGLSEAEREIGLREEAERETEISPEIKAAKPSISAKPERKMRPGLKRFLWEGRPEIGAPGLGAPIKGWMDIAELLGKGAKKGYEYTFPRTR